MLDKYIQTNECLPYTDFDEIKKIGSGGYATVYIARYKNYLKVNYPYINIPQTVVLKRFKSFDETPELFISEVSNNW